jgi:hypothetical protein
MSRTGSTRPRTSRCAICCGSSHRAGNDLDARSWAQLLLQTNGVESPEDLPNLDSYLTVHEVFPRGLRTAAAVASG